MAKSVWWALAGASTGAAAVGAAWWVTYEVTRQGPVVAQVGDKVIYERQLAAQVESVAGSQVLTDLITKQLVNQAAAKEGLTVTSQEVNQALKNLELANGITSDQELAMALAASNMTLAQLKDNVRTQVLAEKVAEHEVNVTDAQVAAYYKAHRKQFKQPLTKVKAQIIRTIKQQKAPPPAKLLAGLAKTYKITIVDPRYANVKTQIENPASGSS
ncbi:hypothetical protein GCM10010885_08220 [Alicyclobacillus cellulosilyticus]|uniref:peptidylprolyl isomerase n=1 Tax=Alicyclobacillus cellulosilyticus TaxID=1003997 RepID=A0A917NJ08_9BACL|nr:SurA N-terminal domain-containing protein [Alicyclobacillus cellulosilyticus]GGJ01379.1 hypothetical protein GCM10010885_08220 [Alicyclobacillus cellulosilyticus]